MSKQPSTHPVCRYHLLACEVLYREVCQSVARCRNTVDVSFLSQGLHDLGADKMSARLQTEIDRVDADRYQALLLGFGLCNNGVVGLQARSLPLVIPKAHDCITLFFGSKARYQTYFDNHPGTYFQTTGWMERDDTNLETMDDTIMSSMGLGSYEDYVEKFGEEQARYLADSLGLLANYRQYTYIRMGLPADDIFERLAGERAVSEGLGFEVLDGDYRLLDALLAGDWSAEEFLVVPPGQTIRPCWSGGIVKTET